MSFVLRLVEDYLNANARHAPPTALPRAIFVTAGSVHVGDRHVVADEGVVTTERQSIEAGPEGACIWRWEVSPASSEAETIGTTSTLRMQAAVFEADVSASHLLRLDSVAFPPGGCAYLHTHQGPGIRCLIDGRIRIDAEGHSASFGPGSPWFEAGPDPVFAQADAELPTRFIRVSVLPKELAGQSSIRYVNEEDQAKPKSQTYRVFDEKLLG